MKKDRERSENVRLTYKEDNIGDWSTRRGIE